MPQNLGLNLNWILSDMIYPVIYLVDFSNEKVVWFHDAQMLIYQFPYSICFS